jgi:hypothetical protein
VSNNLGAKEVHMAAWVNKTNHIAHDRQVKPRHGILRVEIAALEQQIETVGGGRFAALVTELDSFDRDDAALQLAELQERSEELRHDRDDAS